MTRSTSHVNSVLAVISLAFLVSLAAGTSTPALSREGIPSRRDGGATRISHTCQTFLFQAYSTGMGGNVIPPIPAKQAAIFSLLKCATSSNKASANQHWFLLNHNTK
jgi:hypothetical protein